MGKSKEGTQLGVLPWKLKSRLNDFIKDVSGKRRLEFVCRGKDDPYGWLTNGCWALNYRDLPSALVKRAEKKAKSSNRAPADWGDRMLADVAVGAGVTLPLFQYSYTDADDGRIHGPFVVLDTRHGFVVVWSASYNYLRRHKLQLYSNLQADTAFSWCHTTDPSKVLCPLLIKRGAEPVGVLAPVSPDGLDGDFDSALEEAVRQKATASQTRLWAG